MFNVTSEDFSFCNNTLRASRVVHVTRDFLTCYFCSHYSSMLGSMTILYVILFFSKVLTKLNKMSETHKIGFREVLISLRIPKGAALIRGNTVSISSISILLK